MSSTIKHAWATPIPLFTFALLAMLNGVAIGSGNVLFVRGADRSGGFLEAGSDSGRTEQLADIFNTSTSGGNHGWSELRLTLEGEGFVVSQMIEPLADTDPTRGQTDGAGIAFEEMDLTAYDAIMFGSNNAEYSTVAVDAVEEYIRGGGGAIFISDANFGSDWADASNSDQQFLDRFGLIAHQDQGTYSINSNEFLVPDHPIFDGVEQFDGEGVTPIEVGELTEGVEVQVLARAEGSTRLNEPPFGNRNQGRSRASQADDAVLLYATADAGRVIGHFDRNTFFNRNGAGTNINRFSNRQYAINLFHAAVGQSMGVAGDFNDSGSLDVADIELLSLAIRENQTDPTFDLDGDGIVDALDRKFWIEDLANTWAGDSNFDGEFNSGDFVFVFAAGEYEDEADCNSTFATGDWNGDCEFDSSDFVSAFGVTGYELGPRPAAAVPEPNSILLASLATFGWLGFRRR